MRIAYFAHYFPPAKFAASVNTYEIVKRLASRGHKVLVFSQPTFSKYTAPKNLTRSIRWPVNVEVYPSLPTPLPLSVTIPHFLNVFRALKHEYDLAITQFHPFHCASFAGFVVKAFRGEPWIVKVQDIILDPSLPPPLHEKIFTHLCYRAFLDGFGKNADKLLVTTSELRCFLEENGYSPNRIAVFPHGVDTKLFSPTTSKKESSFSKTILYVGSMRPQYGLDNLVKAFALLDPIPDIKLVLIGDGSERPRLIELTKKLRLERRVVFHRYIPHESIPEFIRSAYVTVGPLRSCLPNYYTIPTKLLEYFACGKTVVSSRVSKDILIDGHTGLVLKRTTSESIAKALSILIDDEKITARLGKNARRLVVERFDWEKTVNILEREMRDVKSH